jgi:hypothetical protein
MGYEYPRRRRRDVDVPWGAVAIILIVLVVAYFGYYVWFSVQVDYRFDTQIGDKFELSDRASDAKTKLMYLDQFIEALKANGLTEGQTAIFWPRPTSDLAQNYNTVLSLRERLAQLADMEPNSMQYQQGMTQITLQEYCWFPINIFKQGYELKNGIWWAALLPHDVQNRCSTKST